MDDYGADDARWRELRGQAAIDELLAILQERQARNDETTARRQYVFRLAAQRALAAAPAEHAGMKRRQFLQYLAATGGGTVTSDQLQQTLDTLERLGKALTSTCRIDEVALQYLDSRFAEYWHDYYVTKLPGSELLPYARTDLDVVGSLLSQSLAPAVRQRLCAIAGKGATVVGALVWDAGRYGEARRILKTAVGAAQEAGDPSIESVAWAWTSLGWTYDAPTRQHYHSALQTARAGRSLHLPDTVLGAWLASIEAEVHANLADRSACLRTLHDVQRATNLQAAGDDWYWSRFDEAGVAGFRGVCMLKLDRPEEACAALQEAVGLLDPSERHRRLTYLIDLALALARAENVEESCLNVKHALQIANEVRSPVKRQRLKPLRQELRTHGEARCVTLLEEEMSESVEWCGNVC